MVSNLTLTSSKFCAILSDVALVSGLLANDMSLDEEVKSSLEKMLTPSKIELKLIGFGGWL